MRKVIFALANSLDNFIARADGGADWLIMDGEVMKEFPKFFKSIDTVLMGRKTYDLTLTQGQEACQDKADFMGMKTYVFSRTMKESPNAEVEIVSDNAGEFVRDLKNRSGKDIWLMGGGNLAASLM